MLANANTVVCRASAHLVNTSCERLNVVPTSQRTSFEDEWCALFGFMPNESFSDLLQSENETLSENHTCAVFRAREMATRSELEGYSVTELCRGEARSCGRCYRCATGT